MLALPLRFIATTKPLRVLGWLSVIAGIEAVGSMALACKSLGLTPDPVLMAYAFLITFIIYNRDRLDPRELAIDHQGRPEFAQWLSENHLLIGRLVKGSVVALVVTLGLRPVLIPFSALFLLAAFTYAQNFELGERTMFCWKKLPFGKSLLGILWAALVVVLPVLHGGADFTPRVWAVALSFVLIDWSLGVINDLRDLNTDAAEGVRSLPVMFGPRRARVAGSLFLLLSSLIAIDLDAWGILLAALMLGAILLAHRVSDDAKTRSLLHVWSLSFLLLSLI